MTRFRLGNAAGDPWTTVSPNKTASSMTGWETQFNASVVDQIDPAAFNTGIYPWFNVKDVAYGATGDGATDDLTFIQAAINACEAVGGGVVFFPRGQYNISAALTVQGSVRLVGENSGVIGDVTGTSIQVVTLYKIPGSATVDMVTFAGSDTDAYISGCGIENISFVLNTIASAFSLHRVQNSIFRNVHAGNVSSAWRPYCVRLYGGCRFNSFFDCTFIAVGAGNALWLDGENQLSGTGGCTQNSFWHMRLTYGITGGTGVEGGLVFEGDCDNNNVYHAHFINAGPTLPSVSGTYGVVFKNGAGNPRMNNIYYMAGFVHSESNGIGNRIFHMTGENGGVDIDTGAILHYSVVDNVTRGMYQTPQLAIREKIHLDPAQLTPIAVSGNSPAIGGFITNRFPSLDFPITNTTRAGINLSGRNQWGDGNIVGVVIHHAHPAATTTEVVRLRFQYGQATPGDGVQEAHTVQEDESFDVACGDTANRVQRDTLTFVTPWPYNITNTQESLMSMTIDRDFSVAGDTLTDPWQLMSITLLWEGAPSGGENWQYGYRGV